MKPKYLPYGVKRVKWHIHTDLSAYFVNLSLVFSTRQLTNEEVTRKRNELFGQEKARQMALVSRIEKIEVRHKGTPEECTLLMNKGLSTPFNCAMRMKKDL